MKPSTRVFRTLLGALFLITMMINPLTNSNLVSAAPVPPTPMITSRVVNVAGSVITTRSDGWIYDGENAIAVGVQVDCGQDTDGLTCLYADQRDWQVYSIRKLADGTWTTPTLRAKTAGLTMVNSITGIQAVAGSIMTTRQDGMIYDGQRAMGFGQELSCAKKRNGLPVCGFVNRFANNLEAYFVEKLPNGSWTLPTNMSYTTGESRAVRIAVDPYDDTIYGTWMDFTPGYWTVYFARWDGRFWSNRPFPSGRGQFPDICVSESGTVGLTWEDEVWDYGSAILAVLIPEEMLPLLVSDEPETEVARATALDALQFADLTNGTVITGTSNLASHMATLATLHVSHPPSHFPAIIGAADGFFHVVWYEEGGQVKYVYGVGVGWARPVVIATNTESRKPLLSKELPGITLAWADTDGALFTRSKKSTFLPWDNARRWATDTNVFNLGGGLVWVTDSDVVHRSYWPALWIPLMRR